MEKATWYVILGTALLLALYDVWVIWYAGEDASISRVFYARCKAEPIWAGLMSILFWHLVGPNR